MPALGLLAAFAILIGGGSAGARGSSVFKPCHSGGRVLCGTVVVPLDISGKHRGTVGLHVEVLPAAGLSIGASSGSVMFLVAGGPGQASAAAFSLTEAGSIWQSIFPGYTLVAYDDRGTGLSGKINCPGIDAIITALPAASTRLVGVCGRTLGVRSSDYSTLANAYDMDAIRRALGADKVSIFGVSYGTKQALGYAVSYPSHVARLVLDSVVSPSWPDNFYSATLHALPGALDQICHDACRGLTTNEGADFVKLTNELAAHPHEGAVLQPSGKRTKIRLDGYAMIELGIDTDLVPGIAAALPAAVHAGLTGNPAPLERLAVIDDEASNAGGSAGVNVAINIATDCSDGRFFWSQKTPIAQRVPRLEQALSHLTAADIGPFGKWVALGGTAQGCVDWPVASSPTVLRTGPWPNVPVLILSGSRDDRTPTPIGRAVSHFFPKSRFLVVKGSGHAVTYESPCADEFVSDWVQGIPHPACPAIPLELAPLHGFPTAPPGTEKLSPAQTFAVAATTLQEAEATTLVADQLGAPVSGLTGGTLRASESDTAKLVAYADVDGVTLTGTLSVDPGGRADATMTIGGSRAAAGRLALFNGVVRGNFGGHDETAKA